MSDATAYLRRSGLLRLWLQARERWEANGGPSGLVRLDELTAEEAHDIAGLLGTVTRKPIAAGGQLRVTVATLDRALHASRFALSVTDALELVAGPLRSRPAERVQRRAQAAAFWAAFDEHPATADPRTRAWLATVSSTGGLARLARRRGGRHLHAALDALARLPAEPPIARATLAAQLTGDPHALDDGTTSGALTLSALAAHAADDAPADARQRRALWERFGVLCDRVSSTVLAVNLPVRDDPLRATFAAWAGQPVSLTLAQIDAAAVRVPAATRVFCCENPAVLTAAVERFGERCPPMVCVSGQPSVAVLWLLERLAEAGARLNYHGDFDAGGLRVAGRLASAVLIEPWQFDARHYRDAVARGLGSTPVVAEVPVPPGYEELSAAIGREGLAVFEEQLLDELLDELGQCEGPCIPPTDEAQPAVDAVVDRFAAIFDDRVYPAG